MSSKASDKVYSFDFVLEQHYFSSPFPLNTEDRKVRVKYSYDDVKEEFIFRGTEFNFKQVLFIKPGPLLVADICNMMKASYEQMIANVLDTIENDYWKAEKEFHGTNKTA